MPLLQHLSIPYTQEKFCISILSWWLVMLHDDFHIRSSTCQVKKKACFDLTGHIKKPTDYKIWYSRLVWWIKYFSYFHTKPTGNVSHTWLIVGSLVRSIWNTGGGRVCCRTCSSCCGCPHTAMALVKWSTPFSYSPVWQITQCLEINHLPHCNTFYIKHTPRVD